MVIRGQVLVAKSKADYYSCGEEQILVVRDVLPDIVLFMNRISVIITEVNNPLCHAAIVAREFKKPILMGIRGATKKFTTGEVAEVNLDKKEVCRVQ